MVVVLYEARWCLPGSSLGGKTGREREVTTRKGSSFIGIDMDRHGLGWPKTLFLQELFNPLQ